MHGHDVIYTNRRGFDTLETPLAHISIKEDTIHSLRFLFFLPQRLGDCIYSFEMPSKIKREKNGKRKGVVLRKKSLLDHFEEDANVDGTISMRRHSAAFQNRLLILELEPESWRGQWR